MRLPLKRRPMGRIERINMSFVRWMSFVPSRRRVVRWSRRVPAAYNTKKQSFRCACQTGRGGGCAYRKAEVESNEEDGVPKVESVVQVVIVDDDGGREHDPDRDNGRGGQLVFWLWRGRGGGGGQRTVTATVAVAVAGEVGLEVCL